MKKHLIFFVIFLFLLSSCNLDSDGIFQQIYGETEKNSIKVSYMVGESNEEIFFSTDTNGIAKTSSPYSGYDNVYSPSDRLIRFMTSDGEAVCSSISGTSTYYLVNLESKTEQKLTITVDGSEAVVQGAYFNPMPSDEKSVLTLVLRTKSDTSTAYFLYYGAQPKKGDDGVSLIFSTADVEANKVDRIPEEKGVPQIIGPGKYTFAVYQNDEEQKTWVIGNAGTVSSRPRLWFDSLLILENGDVYSVDEGLNKKYAAVSLTHYDANSILAAGYVKETADGTGKIYGITDKFTFSYDVATNEFKSYEKSTNMFYVGMINADKVATTENSIQTFNKSNL